MRTFTHVHVRQLQAAARDTLIALAYRVPLLDGADTLCFVDIDSMLRRVYGKQKQGIGFGHAKVGGYNVYLRGYNPLATSPSRCPPGGRLCGVKGSLSPRFPKSSSRSIRGVSTSDKSVYLAPSDEQSRQLVL